MYGRKGNLSEILFSKASYAEEMPDIPQNASILKKSISYCRKVWDPQNVE